MVLASYGALCVGKVLIWRAATSRACKHALPSSDQMTYARYWDRRYPSRQEDQDNVAGQSPAMPIDSGEQAVPRNNTQPTVGVGFGGLLRWGFRMRRLQLWQVFSYLLGAGGLEILVECLRHISRRRLLCLKAAT
jgi:hypothetical protein